MNIPPINLKDSYKIDHVHQYPKGTTKVYSNLTARYAHDPDIKEYVVFGIQYLLIEYLQRQFNANFFAKKKQDVLRDYKRRIDGILGKDAVNIDHIAALHDLGRLPVHIKALPEGTLCPIGVPCMTITNTHDDFFWLPNFLETLISTTLWGMMTSATTALRFRKLLQAGADVTSDETEMVNWQCHDFSMRGMFGVEAAAMSGAAHLLFFTGTDCIPAIDFLEEYYLADSDAELIGGSVPATEHSVMCMDGAAGEYDTYKRLLTDVYKTGIVSVVSDTWDYWTVIEEYLPLLKPTIIERDGKLVIRPDSGDPVQIILETIPKLWDIFGGTINSKGYKQLDPHIGLIYGDGINIKRAETIVLGLLNLGFSSTNVVFGVGSYTYQYVTRDTLGTAMKATYGEVNGEAREIYKDPKTDSGIKRSAKGLLKVTGDKELIQQVSWQQEELGMLRTVFLNGRIEKTTLKEIRERLGWIK